MWLLVPCTSAKREEEVGRSLTRLGTHSETVLPHVPRTGCLLVSWCRKCALMLEEQSFAHFKNTLINFVRRYLYSRVGVLFDPLDDGLIDQLLGLCVQAVVGQIGYQVVLGDAEDLFLACHLKKKDSIAKKLSTFSDTI